MKQEHAFILLGVAVLAFVLVPAFWYDCCSSGTEVDRLRAGLVSAFGVMLSFVLFFLNELRNCVKVAEELDKELKVGGVGSD